MLGRSRRHKQRPPRAQRVAVEELEVRRLLSGIGLSIKLPLEIINPDGAAGVTGLTPQQVSDAYAFNQISFNGGTIAGTGAGQTVAIVDAYDNPQFVDSSDPNFVNSDLHAFDAAFGLPDPPSFTKVEIDGMPAPDPFEWGVEIALDVEWVHALAPQANIVLVEAANSGDLFDAVNYASANANVVSMSWGSGEFTGETSLDSYFSTPNVTYIASAGDEPLVSYPAISPDVLGVGGTTLQLNGNSYAGETGWGGSGGGVSTVEPKPPYQNNVTQSSTYRTSADVSFDADPNSGVAIYDSDYDPSSPWLQVGGTSFSAPAWAALIAVANQGRALEGLAPLDGATQTLPTLYAAPPSDFHAITGAPDAGYNLFTGLGSPIANQVVTTLVSEAPLRVVSSTPAAGTLISNTAPPVDFVLKFTNALSAASVQASDFTVNGIAATSVQMDATGTQLTFQYSASPVTTPGTQTMTMAAGAVERAYDNAPNQAFSATFTYQAAQLQVVSTTPANGSVVQLPMTSLSLTFNEAVNPSSLKGTLILSQGSASSVTYSNNNQTMNFTLTGVTGGGVITATLNTGAISDAYGFGNLAYSETFLSQPAVTAISGHAFVQVLPAGSLVYKLGSSVGGTILFGGDTINYTVPIVGGQTLTILDAPGATLEPTITLMNSAGSVIGSATTSTPGQTAVLQNAAIANTGTYTLVFGSANSTTGTFSVNMYLNAAVEAAGYGAPADTTLATAQNLDSAFSSLGGAAQTAAVLGTTTAQYTVTDLGALSSGGSSMAYGINDSGQIVGQVSSTTLNSHNYYSWNAFVWNNGVMTDLGTLGGDNSYASDINSSGQIVGYSDIDSADIYTHAFLYSNGTLIDLGTLGGVSSNATGINDAGEVVGNADPSSNYPEAFYYVNGHMTGLGTFGGPRSSAAAVNATGQIVGQADLANNGGSDVFLYSGGTMNNIPALDGIDAGPIGLNNSGEIIGVYASHDTFPGFEYINGTFTGLYGNSVGINNNGEVVGATLAGGVTTNALVFSNGMPLNLNGLIAPGSGWALTNATGVNDKGQIVGYGTIHGNTHAFLLTPIVSQSSTPFTSYYSFTLAAGDTVSVNLKALTGAAPNLALENAQGSVVASGVGSASTNVNEVITDFTASTAGTYYAAVTGTEATYNLAITKDAEFQNQANFTLATAQPLSSASISGNQVVLGYQTGSQPGEYYSFTVTAGTELGFQTGTPGGAGTPGIGEGAFENPNWPGLALYNSSGTELASANNTAPDGVNSRLTYTVPTTGTYYIDFIGNTEHSAFGEYTIDFVQAGPGGGASPVPGTPVIDPSSNTSLTTAIADTSHNNAPGKPLSFSVGQTVVGATVTLYINGVADGSAIASSTTTDITVNSGTVLADGAYSVDATQTAAGESASLASGSEALTIDTTPPATPTSAPFLSASDDTGVSDTDNITNNNKPDIQVNIGTPWVMYMDGLPATSGIQFGAGWLYTAAIPDGVHTFWVRAEDQAGNLSAPSPSTTITIDTQAYSVPSVGGGLDTTFGSGGVDVTPGTFAQYATSVVQSPSDLIVAVGDTGYANADNSAIELVCYNANGTLDTNFGTGGVVITSLANGCWAYNAAIGVDGKIVVAGASTAQNFVLRYDSNGTLDSTFASGGIYTLAGFTPMSVAVNNISLQILVGGLDGGDMALLRLLGNGQLDTGFNNTGMVEDAFSGQMKGISALTIESNEDIVAAGQVMMANSTWGIGVMRFSVGGYVDTTFNGTGMAEEQVADDTVNGVMAQTDGKIIAYGNTLKSSQYDALMERFNVNGSLDTTFDGDGFLESPCLYPGGYTTAAAVVEESLGTLLLAQPTVEYFAPSYYEYDAQVTRLHADGSVDTLYGDGGTVLTPLSSTNPSVITAGALQYNGDLLVAGYEENSSGTKSVLVLRYTDGTPTLPIPTLDPGSETGPNHSPTLTNDNTPTLDLPTPPGYYARVYRNGTLISSLYYAGSTITVPKQADGTSAYTMAVVDTAGNVTAQGVALNLTVNTAVPAAPPAPVLTSGTNVNGASLLSNPTFSVSAGPYFRFYVNGNLVSGLFQTGASFTVPPLANGVYTMTVAAEDAAGNLSAPSAGLTVTIASPISAPEILGIVAGNGQASLSWAASAGAASYVVERSTNPAGPTTVVASGVAVTSYVDKGLTDGVAYFYVLAAVSGANQSANSAQMMVVPASPLVAIAAAPTGLTATAGNGHVTLSWIGSAGAATYSVLRATSGSGPFTAVSSNQFLTSYTDASVQGGAAYYYVVTALDDGGQSPNSVQAHATVGVGATPSGWEIIPTTNGESADFNHDGVADLLLENINSGQFGTWLVHNGSAPTWSNMGSVPTGWTITDIGDFNGDGTTDLLLQNSSNGYIGAWLISNGTISSWSLMGAVPTGWSVLRVGDFTGNGTDDLLLQNSATGQTGIWLINNGHISGWVNLGTVPSGWNLPAIGSLTGNGIQDLLLWNQTSGILGAWMLNGSGQLSSWDYITTLSPSTYTIGIGDFTGNGTGDILVENISTGLLGTWFISGGAISGGFHAMATLPAGWNIDYLGDFNGDGKTDFLLENGSSGQIGAWLVTLSAGNPQVTWETIASLP